MQQPPARIPHQSAIFFHCQGQPNRLVFEQRPGLLIFKERFRRDEESEGCLSGPSGWAVEARDFVSEPRVNAISSDNEIFFMSRPIGQRHRSVLAVDIDHFRSEIDLRRLRRRRRLHGQPAQLAVQVHPVEGKIAIAIFCRDGCQVGDLEQFEGAALAEMVLSRHMNTRCSTWKRNGYVTSSRSNAFARSKSNPQYLRILVALGAELIAAPASLLNCERSKI